VKATGRTDIRREIDRSLTRIEKKVGDLSSYVAYANKHLGKAMRDRWELMRACKAAYAEVAPRQRNGRRVQPRTLAKLTRAQVDARWDYSRRHLAHRLAKAIEAVK
jgi:hypothetical protein